MDAPSLANIKHFDASLLMSRDAHAFERASRKKSFNRNEIKRFTESANRVRERATRVPAFSYQPGLPITRRLPEIESLLKHNQVLIVAGETGSGKTTQIPLACLNAGLGVRGMICHTQPRRLAARSVADRIASQLNVKLGHEVGYAVRFDDQVGDTTLLKVMTDGLLLNEVQRDRFLNAYDTIIVDEAHERSLNIDFLLGCLKLLIQKRGDLRVIVTSATIDVQEFSSFFDSAPVVSVEGRAFPVDVRYRPIESDIETTVADCIGEIREDKKSGVRDILMFLSGERDIFEWSHWFRKSYQNQFEILPLYARLPPKEQQKIFKPSDKQRILLATNVAETSLTVPNVRYVIDVGLARVSRYSLQSRIQRLPNEPISQASANQRAGRCGRLAPGICFRLYSEDDFTRRAEYTTPEIRRTNLASVVLRMMVFRFGDIETFPFLDRPDNRAFASAKRMLTELGALEGDSVTSIGRRMARLPIDPRLARMLIEAEELDVLTEVLTVVSALAAQDPRLRPLDRQIQADLAQDRFRNKSSDFMSFVQLWDWLEGERKSMSQRHFRRLLETNFISPLRVEEWRSLHRQLRIACLRQRMTFNNMSASVDKVHRAILSGSLNFVGLRFDGNNYVGMRELEFRLFPGSTLASTKPKWVVAAEIVETSQTFARCVARIEPSWIEKYAESLLRRTMHDPYWDSRRAKCMVLLDLSLSGLMVVQNRRANLADYDAIEARKMFSCHALVRNEGKINELEIKANRELVVSLRELEARERKFNVVAGEKELVEYYVKRLPESVNDSKSFKHWYKNSDDDARANLRMSPEDVLLVDKIHLRADAFPPEVRIGQTCFRLKYSFAPGRSNDGVSLEVTPADLHLISVAFIEWLVPGFVEEKVMELLRSLPKQLRKSLAPIPEKVPALTSLLLQTDTYRKGSMLDAMSDFIQTQFNVDVNSELWNLSRLSPHLRMNVIVVEANGGLIDQDRNLEALKQRTAQRIEAQIDSADTTRYEVLGIKSFPKEGILWERTLRTSSGPVVAYTHILDRRDGVDISLRPRFIPEEDESIWGMCRFVYFVEKQSVQYLKSEFDKLEQLQANWSHLGDSADLLDSILLRAISHVYFKNNYRVATTREFNEILRSNRGRLVQEGITLIDHMAQVLGLRQRVNEKIGLLSTSPAYNAPRNDLEIQLRKLVPAALLRTASNEFLNEIPRYLNAMLVRIEGLPGKLRRDNELVDEIHKWENRLEELKTIGGAKDNIEDLQIQLQEYRISLFCQTLRTKTRVSPKRLETQFSELERDLGSAL